MKKVRPDYNYKWDKENDVADLTEFLASQIKSVETPKNIDIEIMFLTLLKIYKDWYELHTRDLQLQALLAVALACTWLHENDPEKMGDLLCMLTEVGKSILSTSPVQLSVKNFVQEGFTVQGVTDAVERALGATVKTTLVNPDYIEIYFVNGDYGEGPFNGVLMFDVNEGLSILNSESNDRQVYQGAELPKSCEELEEALLSELWKSTFHFTISRKENMVEALKDLKIDPAKFLKDQKVNSQVSRGSAGDIHNMEEEDYDNEDEDYGNDDDNGYVNEPVSHNFKQLDNPRNASKFAI